MGLFTRAVWSIGRGAVRSVNKANKKNGPIWNDEINAAIEANREKKLNSKLEKKNQKKIEKENRILEKAIKIVESRDPNIPESTKESSLKNGKNRTTKIFKA
jgi:hypothetical protein